MIRCARPLAFKPVKIQRRWFNTTELSKQIDRANEAQQLKNSEVSSFLRTIADRLESKSESLVTTAMKESKLPRPRLEGELKRTSNQLRLFGNVVEEGSWVDARINGAVRSTLVPLGTVAVFGASNFPLAFSTTGGDTASALAAKCTVVYKTHPAHPETTNIAYSAVREAIQQHKLPDGVFQITETEKISGPTRNATQLHLLATSPKISGVGFTGSHKVGKLIMDLAASRPDPIPVYCEMGSVNPLFILPNALETKSQSIAEGLCSSFTLGCGQFCTKPGLVFVVGNEQNFRKFTDSLVEAAHKVEPTQMLTDGILRTFKRGCEDFIQNVLGIPVAITDAGGDTTAGLYQREIFGPAVLLVHSENVESLANLHLNIHGQLTTSFHGTENDLKDKHVISLIENMSSRVGRVVWGGFPTGVEVNHAMHHGGPYPATSDQRMTSVGTRAILRWVRPLCYQGFPESLLPPELQQENPLRITRLVDGNVVAEKK